MTWIVEMRIYSSFSSISQCV